MKTIILLLLLVPAIAQAQSFPDGTLVFSNKPGTIVGNIARRLADGDHYTHVGWVYRNRVYEMDFPRALSVPVSQYGKRGTVNDYYVPTAPVQGLAQMHVAAQSMMGQRYGLRGFLRPSKRPGVWCSPFVGKVLNAGGHNIPPAIYHKPQTLLNHLRPNVRLAHRVVR